MATDHAGREIFTLVADRVKQRKDSLRHLRSLRQVIGIEGWLKVEAIAILPEYVEKVNNNGNDLILKLHEDKVKIELRAATDFNPIYIKKGATDHKTLCLFLGDGSNKEKIEELLSDEDIDVIDHESFDVNGDKWIIGMIKPSDEYLVHHAH